MKKKNDVVESYYDNGQLKSRTNYKNDELEGLYERWYDNGQPESRINYENGKLDGLYEAWYENGQLRERAIYKDGVKQYSNVNNKHEQNMVEQESDRNISKEEKLLRLERENLALKIMILRDKQVAREITFKESLKQSVRLIEEYDKNKIENYGFR